ncbi:hypothetical protein HMPREF0731_4456, partial [Pseudoroseomonas cervicalis ATCC 49957]
APGPRKRSSRVLASIMPSMSGAARPRTRCRPRAGRRASRKGHAPRSL